MIILWSFYACFIGHSHCDTWSRGIERHGSEPAMVSLLFARCWSLKSFSLVCSWTTVHGSPMGGHRMANICAILQRMMKKMWDFKIFRGIPDLTVYLHRSYESKCYLRRYLDPWVWHLPVPPPITWPIQLLEVQPISELQGEVQRSGESDDFRSGISVYIEWSYLVKTWWALDVRSMIVIIYYNIL